MGSSTVAICMLLLREVLVYYAVYRATCTKNSCKPILSNRDKLVTSKGHLLTVLCILQ